MINLKKVSVFNEKYIEDYVYQQNELIKNSFEIFVKSPDYDTHIKEIEKLLESINITFSKSSGIGGIDKSFSNNSSMDLERQRVDILQLVP